MVALAGLLILLAAVVSAPLAVALGALFGFRVTDGQPRALRGLAAWLCGALLAYFVAMLWFIPTFVIAGNTDPSTMVNVIEGSPAELAGIQNGDRVIAVNGRGVASWEEIKAQVVANPPTERDAVDVERSGRRHTLYVTPVDDRIGIVTLPKGGPPPVVRTGASVLLLPFQSLRLVLRALSPEPQVLGGPIAVLAPSSLWASIFLRAGIWSSLLGAVLVLLHLLLVPVTLRLLERRAARR
jgi:regulator of sigma E protease